MAQKVRLDIKSGLPFKRALTVTLPTGRSWWTDEADFEFAMQIREEEDRSSRLICDLLPYLVTDKPSADIVTVQIIMSGEDTRLVTESGWYDLIMSDVDIHNDRAYQLLAGPLKRRSTVSRDAGE